MVHALVPCAEQPAKVGLHLFPLTDYLSYRYEQVVTVSLSLNQQG